MSNWEKSKEIIRSVTSLKNKRVIDIGCGDGWFLSWCSNEISSGTGIDPSKEQILLAKEKINNKNISFENLGAENLKKLNDIYDLIFFFNSLHHVPTHLMASSLEEASKVMHKNSILIIIEPIAKGNFYKFMKDIDDEFEVRQKAYESIKNCKYNNLINQDEIFYEEIKSFDNFEKCIKFLKNVDKNKIKYINDNMENIRNLFNDLSILKNKRFEFKQPMRINLLSLMKG